MIMLKRVLALILCLCALASFACAEDDLGPFQLKHGSRDSKKVAITVDDCYKTATEWIAKDVELCKQYGIHMTFFPLYKTGCLFPEYRELWQSVLDAGCEIGCHGRSWTRPWDTITRPAGCGLRTDRSTAGKR